MKLKAVVLVAIPVLLIAAAALFYWYIRGQAQPILIDDPVPVSSQPVEQTPIDNVIIPEIAVPVPDATQQPTQDDALTPETVLPDNPTSEVTPDVKDDKQPASPPKDTPKGGDTNEKGQKWFPGFGWVDDEGEGTHDTANMDPNGNIVGY